MAIPRRANSNPPPVHPGEILREEFMAPMGMSAHALAMKLRVPATRVLEIVNERRSVTADTALRLGTFFHTSADLWMNLQKSYELALARRDFGAKIEQEVQPRTIERQRKTA